MYFKGKLYESYFSVQTMVKKRNLEIWEKVGLKKKEIVATIKNEQLPTHHARTQKSLKAFLCFLCTIISVLKRYNVNACYILFKRH